MFSYNPVHQVVVCHAFKFCIITRRSRQERHLRAEPHRLSGEELKTTLKLLNSHKLRIVRELKGHQPGIKDRCRVIKDLACYSGFYRLELERRYSTRHFRDMRKHMPLVHQIKAAAHKNVHCGRSTNYRRTS